MFLAGRIPLFDDEYVPAAAEVTRNLTRYFWRTQPNEDPAEGAFDEFTVQVKLTAPALAPVERESTQLEMGMYSPYRDRV